MLQVKQSDATAANRWIPFRCFDDDSADAYAPKTGLTFASGELKIAKAGVANANAANYATVVEAGLGWYWYQASATEINTLGPMMLVVNKTDVYADCTVVQVSAPDFYSATNFGLSNLATSTASLLTAAAYQDVDDILDAADSIETGLTLRGAVRLMAAALAGKSTGAGTSTEYYRSAVSDGKVRLTATISANNRTAITTDTDA